MAISRIPGYALISALDRQGTDLSFVSTTNSGPLGATLLYMDFAGFTVGINEANPTNFGQSLVVNGNILIESGHLITTGNAVYSLGNITNQWNTVYANSLAGTLITANQPNITNVGILQNLTISGNLTVANVNIGNLFITGNLNAGNNRIINVANPIVGSDAATKAYVDNALGTEVVGNVISLGTPTVNSGNLQANAAYLGFTTGTYVTDAIDILNSVAENLFTNTFVRSVSFSANVTAGGQGQDVLLTMVPQGNVNQYVINWGDGTGNTTTSSTTATHQYNTNAGTPFTVTVTATNTNGAGPSNTATLSIPGYIQIYGPNPVMSFNLYRTNTGGTVLSGNNLYVIQGNAVYLQNTTTNTNTSTVTWSVLWGDGNYSNVASNSNAGGVLGGNLSYTYNGNSGTGTDTVNLALLTDNIANPSIIPLYTTQALKVYANVPPQPYGVSTRSLSYGTSVGATPYLAVNATDNTGGTTLTAGAAVNRATYNQGVINANAGTVTNTLTYNGNAGILSALINNVYAGNVNLATPQTTGLTGNLWITTLSDYNLFNQSGAATTFASSIYYPGYSYGFEANVTSSGSVLNVGANRFRITHSITGSTSAVDFVVDNIITTPTVTWGNISIATPGTYRYISGIPYFNSGSPTLTVSGVTIGPNWIGQAYTNITNPLQMLSGQNQEGTGSLVIANSNWTYATLSNPANALVNGSNIPYANSGAYSPYTVANLTVSITSSSVRSVANLLIYATNCNGQSVNLYNIGANANIQVHTAAQTGISEIAISANTSGNTNPGVRSTYFLAATTNTPSYVSSTNFMTTPNVYTEAADPGVAGTREATIRIGVLKFSANNYSTGYLPPGPNRSGDGANNQYFTMGYQRSGISGFNLNIVAPAGVAGVWVAAPGTYIDQTSSLNGWLDATVNYGGSGRPGANTGSGGNGSNGCGSGTLIAANVALNGNYTITFGNVSLTTATNNVALIRIALASGQTVTTLGLA